MELDSKKLLVLMAEKGYNVSSLARAAGVAACTVNLYINHGTRPRLDSLGRLAKALGVPVMEIVKEA